MARKLDDYLAEMLERGGSDLHIAIHAAPKIRIDGVIHELDSEVLDAESVRSMIREVMPDHRWERFEQCGDVDLAHEIPGTARFRMNVFKNNWGIAAVLRQVPSRVSSIDELGLPQVLKKVAEYEDGLVLVTGPTGSGKSTTLAAILNHINETRSKEIITIEDPVEFAHEDKKSTFIQREVGEHTRSFAAGLRSAMRADPDVILIGEMRDRETLKLALKCASMGMLVFGTLHTNGAAKSIDRIVDVFEAEEQYLMRVMLSHSLRGVLSQVLCKKESGGRVPAHEILLYHQALPFCIRKNALSSITNIMDQGREAGMTSLDANLRQLLDEGLISQQEAYMKALNKDAFRPRD